MKWSLPIVENKFEESTQLIKSVIGVHFFLALVFITFHSGDLLSNPRTAICLGIAIFYLLISRFYKWQEQSYNYALLFIYGLFLVLELVLLNIPVSSSQMVTNSNDRGFVLDIFLMMAPSIYVGLRILLAIPFILIIYRKKQLEQAVVAE